MKVKIIVSYKYTIYRQVFESPEVEFCSILRGIESNPILSLLLNVVHDTLPEKVLKGCPLTGDYDMMIHIDDSKWMASAVLPTGTYKVEARFLYKNQRKKLYDVTVEAEVVSAIKTSF